MSQLISITTTPIKYERTTTNAKVETTNSQPTHTMETTPGTFKMQAKNIQVKIDTYDARKSMGLMSSFDASVDMANRGKSAASEATGNYTDVGNQMARAHQMGSIADIMAGQFFKTPQPKEFVPIPGVGPTITWEPNELNIEYTPAKLDFHWNTQKPQGKYTPATIDFKILQYPEIAYEYLGNNK